MTDIHVHTADVDTEATLAPDQQQRVNALREARQVLEKQTRGFTSTYEVDAMDLYNIAAFIMTGGDPWAPAQPERPRRRWWGRRAR